MQSRILGRGGSKRALLASAAFGLVACSGGGGGGSSPPSPPAPPSNAAPTPAIAVDNASPDEGQPFIIDASGSTDADGDALTITIVQTSGPDAGPPPLDLVVPTADGVRGFSAPEVDANAEMTFDVTISDGRDSSVESIEVTATNIVLEPTIDLFGETLARFEGLSRPRNAGFLSTSPGDSEMGLVGIEVDEGGGGLQLFRYRNDVVTERFDDKQVVAIENSTALSRVSSTLGVFSRFIIQPAFALEDDDIVIVYQRILNPSPTFVPLDVVSLDVPCALAGTQQGNFTDLLVGSRSSGLRLLLNDANLFAGSIAQRGKFSSETVLVPDGSFCEIAISFGSGAQSLFAYDETVGLLRWWRRVGTSAVSEEGSLDPEIPDGLSVVSVAANVEVSGHYVVAVTATNGTHDGDHRLIILNNDFDGLGDTQRTEFSWSKGVPGKIWMNNLAPQVSSDPDFFVQLRTVPYIAVTRNTKGEILGDSGPEYAPLRFASSALGADWIQFGMGTDLTSVSMAFTRTDEGVVEIVEVKGLAN